MSKLYSPGGDATALRTVPLAAGESGLGWRATLILVAGISLLLLCASIWQDLRLYVGPNHDLSSKIWLLDVDVEQSAFTWVSVLALFFSAQLLFRATGDAVAQRDRFKWHWLVLMVLFLLVSFDELTGLHEKLSSALASRVTHTGLLYFAWAAPAGIIALAGLAAFVPFIRSFPPRLALWALVSAVLYLGGAVGLEMIGGSVAEVDGVESLRYRMLANLEEGLELAGTLLFIYVLLSLNERRGLAPAPALRQDSQ